MKKRKRRLIKAGCMFLLLFAAFFCLGTRLSFQKINRLSAADSDGTFLFGLLEGRNEGSCYILRGSPGGKADRMLRVSLLGEEGESYEIRTIAAAGGGNLVLLADAYGEEKYEGSLLWLWKPEEGTLSEVMSYQNGDEIGPYDNVSFCGDGILLMQFEMEGQGEEMAATVRRTVMTGPDLEERRELPALSFRQATTAYYGISAQYGMWYTDRYGNIYHSREDGTVGQVFANDGSLVSINNVGFSPTDRGAYFYNLDSGQDYWIGEEETLQQVDWSWMETLRGDGFQISYLTFRGDTILTELEQGQEEERAALIFSDGTVQFLDGLTLPVSFWLPWAFLAAAAGTILLSGLYLLLGAWIRRVQVIPAVCRILAAVLVVLLLGGVYVFRESRSIFYARRLEAGKTVLVGAAGLEADALEAERFTEEQPDVNGFELRMYENLEQGLALKERMQKEEQELFLAVDYGYFKVQEGEEYPILGTSYVTTPARYVLTEGELSLVRQAVSENQIVSGVYTERGTAYLAAYVPVSSRTSGEKDSSAPEGISGNPAVAGVIKCSLDTELLQRQAEGEAFSFTLSILGGFLLILTAVFVLIQASLRPLGELRRFIQDLEEEKELNALEIRGHSEISELMQTAGRMSENIREHIRKMTILQKKYEPFVPRELVALLGKEDIRQVEAGDRVSLPAVLLLLEPEAFDEMKAELDAKQLFERLNEGLGILIPRIREAGGQIVRFYRGGVIALFPESAPEAACRVQDMVWEAREKTGISYLGALDRRNVTLEITGCEERMDFTICREDWKDLFALLRSCKTYGISLAATEAVCREEAVVSPVPEARLGAAVSPVPEALQAAEHAPVSEAASEVESGEGRSMRTRFLGEILRRETGETQRIYELLEARDIQFALKQQTADAFARGVALCLEGKAKEGRELFAGILRKNHEDMAARRYFWLCDQGQRYFDEI